MIVETWLDNSTNTDDLLFPNYQTFRRDREIGPNGYGGILVYVRNDIAAQRYMQLEKQSFETMFFKIKYSKYRTVFLAICYRPKWVDVDSFTNHLEDVIDEFRTGTSYHFSDLIFMGDVNGHCKLRYSNSTKETTSAGSHIYEFANKSALLQLVDKATRPKSDTCLDLIFVDNLTCIQSIRLLPQLCTTCDHLIVKAKINCSSEPVLETQRVIYNYKVTDWDNYRAELSYMDWYSVIHGSSLDDAVCLVQNKILGIANSIIPHKTITVSSRDKVWFNEKLRLMLYDKNKAFY
ncbi:unnamed protein product [Didymodactylos carnosus]|uniref:Endonuclease/exonuclease/phosphatase domain-containing protein n=1 Tax=Didymodactylos carnosus TaxID=1234261 RepID=A0A814UMX8_9BILA|nr:unnamed protein product [Didymodactylos carnosus]CAF3940593.1 unnamed protein product [Didymodactylos carnosus]